MRAHRINANLSMEKLADQINVTYQQLQKYETGLNRVSADKLSRIASILKVPISSFFNCDPSEENLSEVKEITQSLLNDRNGIALAKSWSNLTDIKKKAFVELIKTLDNKLE